MNFIQVGYEGKAWIHVGQGRALMTTVMDVWAPQGQEISRPAERRLASQEGLCFMKMVIRSTWQSAAHVPTGTKAV
jgi:hypothetical protein